jgi:23S rRNA (cytosine1962-C5)-methyltransferase
MAARLASAPARSAWGTKRVVFEVDPRVARLEGLSPKAIPSDALRSVRIREHGVRYEVDFESGHKTGFT